MVSISVLLVVRYQALSKFQVSIAILMGIFFRKLGNYGKTGDYIEVEAHRASRNFEQVSKNLSKKILIS